MKSKKKSKSYSKRKEKHEGKVAIKQDSFYKKPKEDDVFTKLADELKQSTGLKLKKEEPVKEEKVIDHCLCCENKCQCCEHPVGITTHFCKCPCHATN